MGAFRLIKKPIFFLTRKFLERQEDIAKLRMVEAVTRGGEMGVDLLSSATPVDSGLTASSWKYGVNVYNDAISLEFRNDNINDGVKIAMIIQYGHATANGYWVEGVDYLNEPQRVIFDEVVNTIWGEVCRA